MVEIEPEVVDAPNRVEAEVLMLGCAGDCTGG